MPIVDLKLQAEVIWAILPTADVRTDQCDALRVYSCGLIGGVRPLPDGAFEWSVTELEPEGDIRCILGPGLVKETIPSQINAARSLAYELKRIAGT